MNVTSQLDGFVQVCVGQSGSLRRLRFDNPKKGEAAVGAQGGLAVFWTYADVRQAMPAAANQKARHESDRTQRESPDARRIAAHIAKTDPNERPPWEHFIGSKRLSPY
jgi:hypothetical protein